VLALRLAAPHPNEQGVTAQVCAAERCQPVPLDVTWRTVKLLLPGVRPDRVNGGSAERVVELRSPTFTAPDGRRLGVLVDRATVYP
jgi:orotidine-5'-phosphate decarboxylase